MRRILARDGLSTLVIERRLSFGGGIGGGGMQLPAILVQKPADSILKDFNCRLQPFNEHIYVVAAIDARAEILLGVSVDDVIFRIENDLPRIVGVVVQWSSTIMVALHVDPVSFKSKAVIDCTGHEAEILSVVSRKVLGLNIALLGEASMRAAEGEMLTVEKTCEVCPGLYVAWMSVANLYRTPRMRPIFGGMLLSGKRVAELMKNDIRRKNQT